VQLRRKYVDLRVLLGLLIAALVGAGSASASVITQTTSSSPDGDVRWTAVYQVGGTGAAREMLLGDPANPPFPASADFAWTAGVAEPFSMSFDGVNTLTMTLGSGLAEETLSLMLDSVFPPIAGDATELLLHVFASSQTTTGAGAPVDTAEVALTDLQLDGLPLSGASAFVGLPCNGIAPSPDPGTNCDFSEQYLSIVGSNLSDGFMLTGIGTLNWAGGVEPPALDRLRWEVTGFRPRLPEPAATLLLAAGLAAVAFARRSRAS